MTDDLEPLSPTDGVKMYLRHREPELSEKSLQNHKYRLDNFVAFCSDKGIDNLNDLTGRTIHKFRNWRRDDDITTVTLRSNLATLRVFLEFTASINAVEPGLRERVKLPEVSAGEESKDVKLDEDRAERILDYLNRFRYASRDHVIVAILWHTGIRLGSLRTFDVDDFDPDAMCLDLQHSPDTGTPLKNGDAAERSIAVGEHYCQMLQDYIDHHRDDVYDDHGRRPLIASTQGRLSETPIRQTVYKWTRPCVVGVECPHDRDPAECEAMKSTSASLCPSSRSPHGIRRGSITKTLRDGTPEEIVTGRMNVSSDVLDQHYDRRTEREKMELRREHLRDA
ncbi:tyrosine-type recombinase/integrase [Haloarchaeobius sp. HRN-SO-5]|uniref:tyrosine-type recombinase/integrase n=1 Tax=Haloarchaeobius sp. HRN-SO-5 TaxID=3446118 RepID=UPI003EBC7EC1